jgi:DNA polymerase V
MTIPFPALRISSICPYHRHNLTPIPYFENRVPAGFPSPAGDYLDPRLDLNDLVIKHPTATFFVRVEGDSMTGAGIHSGDILVVDRAAAPKGNQVVVAVVNGEFTVKRILQRDGRLFLVSENPAMAPMELAEGIQLEVWGVVTYVIHQVE